MREFKFRAFENNKMYYQVRVGGIFDNEATVPTYWDESRRGWIHLIGGKYTKVMQYIGFKDKDGKEIYEGDILEKDGCWSIRVEYDKGSFRVRDLDEVRYINRILDCHIYTFDIENWKVIGNIYENPELLK